VTASLPLFVISTGARVVTIGSVGDSPPTSRWDAVGAGGRLGGIEKVILTIVAAPDAWDLQPRGIRSPRAPPILPPEDDATN
jgi:hypothetical protein